MKRSVAIEFLTACRWRKSHYSLRLTGNRPFGLFVMKNRLATDGRLYANEFQSTVLPSRIICPSPIYCPRDENDDDQCESRDDRTTRNLSRTMFNRSPFEGFQHGTERIINWDRVLCEYSRVKSSRGCLNELSVADKRQIITFAGCRINIGILALRKILFFSHFPSILLPPRFLHRNFHRTVPAYRSL